MIYEIKNREDCLGFMNQFTDTETYFWDASKGKKTWICTVDSCPCLCIKKSSKSKPSLKCKRCKGRGIVNIPNDILNWEFVKNWIPIQFKKEMEKMRASILSKLTIEEQDFIKTWRI